MLGPSPDASDLILGHASPTIGRKVQTLAAKPAGQLGDGAATSLGEVVTGAGARWELQLKGAGKTPYSRQGDGRKVLRSSLREFLCSEAMHGLGIPTTRAACIVTSSTTVERDEFYSGQPKLEAASVVLRLAPTFLRFGSFEIFKPREESNTGRAGPSAAHPLLLPKMLDFTVFYHFREIWAAAGGGATCSDGPPDKTSMYLAFLEEVVQRTAALAAAWQCVGFCHGVLNTDNMSILGLTLDYGPFGFLDRYNSDHVCNGSDDQGRYSFGAQPSICEWNCYRLSDALKTVLPRAEASKVLAKFQPAYAQAFAARMRAKLGLLHDDASGTAATSAGAEAAGADSDEELIQQLLAAMQASGADFTGTFRALSRIPMPSDQPMQAVVDVNSESVEELPEDGGFLQAALSTCTTPQEAAASIGSRVQPQQLKMLQQLVTREPTLLTALGMTAQDVQQEVEKAERARALAEMAPEAKAAEDRRLWEAWLRRYSLRLYRERLAGTTPEQRLATMRAHNPRLVLRNWVAQAAIARAEAGDYTLARRVLTLLESPFQEYSDEELKVLVKSPCGKDVTCQLDQPPPDIYSKLCVTCSS